MSGSQGLALNRRRPTSPLRTGLRYIRFSIRSFEGRQCRERIAVRSIESDVGYDAERQIRVPIVQNLITVSALSSNFTADNFGVKWQVGYGSPALEHYSLTH